MTIYDHWLYRFLTGPLNNVAWLHILLPCVFAGGIYLTVGSGAVQFRRFGYAMKNTAGKLFKKQETAHGAITPLQAVTTALAATVGTGNIAHRVADILRAAFDVRVLCWNPRRTAAECAAWGYEQVATLPELFRRSDFVNVSITLCNETRDLINAPVFAAANPDLMLVNTSRGGIVNEKEMYEALKAGKIGGYATDVLENEVAGDGLTEDSRFYSPLFDLDNFVVSPHIGAQTVDASRDIGQHIIAKVKEALNLG